MPARVGMGVENLGSDAASRDAGAGARALAK
jgi:hypothetical protein